MASYEPVIGLEIHAELKTKTKMFCDSLNDPDEKHPNVNICPVCMGHPGTLPVINKEAVEKVIKVGLALGGAIPEFSQFDRKNYFYPDLPKGYQISQYQHPLVSGGHLDILGRSLRIRRVHLEEDTGRLLHIQQQEQIGVNRNVRVDIKTGGVSGIEFTRPEQFSLVDFNRAGVPLMELVTEPDLRSGEEVRRFGEELRLLLRYMDVSDANMEKGQMRVEVNISLRPATSDSPRSSSGGADKRPEELGTKVEIKNINSFKFAEDAVNYEIKRQASLLNRGEKIKQETRGWDENQGETFSQRSKEEAHDYRYFPEPDLPPLTISAEYIEKLRATLPELPKEKRERFRKEYGLEESIIEVLINDKALADYFESIITELKQQDQETPQNPNRDLIKIAAHFLTGDFLGLLNKQSISSKDTLITPENFAELLLDIAEDKISHLAAKQVLEEMFRAGEDPSNIIDRLGLWQVSDASGLEGLAHRVLEENPRAAEDYKKGKQASLQFLVGQMMRESGGKANPKMVQGLLKRLL